MKYTLKDYQEDAVRDVLAHIARARDDWRRWRSPVAFSLTATTGAGKTVMAAAAIEALFVGNPDYDFQPDPGAVVLWFTDDPSLNQQTRHRLLDASDRIKHSHLVVIENSFDQQKLEPGKVYFLNTQKLSKSSLLVRGAGSVDGNGGQLRIEGVPAPDARAFTIWDTLSNTIVDERHTLYLILDEAHRGMKSTSSARAEKATIVQRLVNGANGVPPIPVVWGISATVERFEEAMAKAEGRTKYPSIVVDPARVQESGLLKDDIRLDFPAEAGRFDTVLLARATRRVVEITRAWCSYAEKEGSTDPVVPLLVVQVPNTPSDELFRSALDTIRESWPELERDGIAHVFGDHTPIELGGVRILHIQPEDVQEATHVRVLFAKDAVSTGWDCPRAEVLISFRTAQDKTHITQLLGRMVRTPLARRIPGNDVLNSVDCALPFFDRATASDVARALIGHREGDADGTGGGDGRRVLFAPVDMEINAAVPECVWATLDALPSQTLPRKAARPIGRLAALAQALSRDGLRSAARKDAYKALFAKLDGLLVQHRNEVARASKGILEVVGETLVARMGGDEVAEGGQFVEAADERSVDADFRSAGRVLTPDLARQYADHIAVVSGDDDGLFDAHVKVAALAQAEGVAEELDRAADKLSQRWLAEYRVAILELGDHRRSVYDQITAMSTQPQSVPIRRPRVRTEETQDQDGRKVPTRTSHLMSDPSGEFPVGSLNSWEIQVLDEEIGRPNFLAWYRNPSRPSEDALAVAYLDGQGHWRRMCPDFLFFHGDADDVRVSIVDPHGIHLGDALPKLRGLAVFASSFGDAFHRIEAVARMEDETLRVLDLKKEAVRAAIQDAKDAESLYRSGVSVAY